MDTTEDGKKEGRKTERKTGRKVDYYRVIIQEQIRRNSDGKLVLKRKE